MPHSFSNVLLHVIFGTKDRRPTITPEIRPRLWAYMGGIIHEVGATTLIINGPDDHSHMFIALPPTLAVADVVRVVKTNSSKWVHEQSPAHHAFAWQSGYSAFSVSQSNVDSLRAYIANQEEHHKNVSFQQEYLTFLKRHGIDLTNATCSSDAAFLSPHPGLLKTNWGDGWTRGHGTHGVTTLRANALIASATNTWPSYLPLVS